MRTPTMIGLAIVLGLVVAMPAAAQSVTEREGWITLPTDQTYDDLLAATRSAIAAEGMGLVSDVGPTEVAAERGETIPGNRVLGVFRNDFAVRAVRASVPAMIEAPIRMYVTENPDGTATLSWKTPSHVFAPYMDEGGAELQAVAEELDTIFVAIGERATNH